MALILGWSPMRLERPPPEELGQGAPEAVWDLPEEGLDVGDGGAAAMEVGIPSGPTAGVGIIECDSAAEGTIE